MTKLGSTYIVLMHKGISGH